LAHKWLPLKITLRAWFKKELWFKLNLQFKKLQHVFETDDARQPVSFCDHETAGTGPVHE